MLFGNAGGAAAAMPGVISDVLTRPAATRPATTALRRRPACRSDGGSGVTPAVTPVRLGIFMWCSCAPVCRPPLCADPDGCVHRRLYLTIATAEWWGSEGPQNRG